MRVLMSMALVSCYGRVDWVLLDRHLVLHQIVRNSSGVCVGVSERAL
jgi:hypothetical protein